MPRIRTVKPDHWNDKELPNISLAAHLFWIGTWNFSDDEGVFENDINFLKNQIFPRRTDIRIEQVSQWIDQLVSARFIVPFVFNNTSYYIHRTFKIHQRIDKPQPSKIPVNIIRRTLLECSKTVLACIGEESTGKGVEGESPPPDFFDEDLIKTENGQEGYAPPKQFVSPALQDVKYFFADLKNSGLWAPDKCETEAGKFFNHYTGNGWKQAGGNLIVDWQAQARKWIAKEKEGAFSGAAKNQNSPPAVKIKTLSKIEKDINWAYSDYCRDPKNPLNLTNSNPEHFDYLEKLGMIDYSEDKVKEIKNQGRQFLKDNKLQSNEIILVQYMKKFGMIEFFKMYSLQGKEVVF